jgi:GPH family glycoside/pentoside/hexuronide:cation symporter
MLGDIADYDEWKNGTRREALFSSLSAWIDKAGSSFGALLSGFLLVWFGFDAKLGAQSEHTLALMKWSYVLAPMTGALLALLLMRKYTLTEPQAYAIKDELARRRVEVPA